MTYGTAADLFEQMFPVYAAKHAETVRRQALKVGEAFQDCAVIASGTMAPAAVVTFIRSCETGGRQLELRVCNIGAKSGGRQVFGAVAKTGRDIKALINGTSMPLDAPMRRRFQSATIVDPDGFAKERRGRAGHSGGPGCMDQVWESRGPASVRGELSGPPATDSLPRPQTFCSAATIPQKLAWQGPRGFAVFKGDFTVDQNPVVTLRLLDTPPLAPWQILGNL
jgi:hypothetical protein